MKRAENIEGWRSRRTHVVSLVAELAEQPRTVRRKPRDAEELALLERAALAAIERRVAEGRLVALGPRSYELRG